MQHKYIKAHSIKKLPGKGHSKQKLALDWDPLRCDDHVDALHPALPLLEEVLEGERRLLPHLALDEVELVTPEEKKEIARLETPIHASFLIKVIKI